MTRSPKGLVRGKFTRKAIQSTLQRGEFGGILRPKVLQGFNQLKQLRG